MEPKEKDLKCLRNRTPSLLPLSLCKSRTPYQVSMMTTYETNTLWRKKMTEVIFNRLAGASVTPTILTRRPSKPSRNNSRLCKDFTLSLFFSLICLFKARE
jgi:hypothetical protein